MEELLEHLKELGFNSYESKVYLALLQNGNSTGYEVSKNSGVPQARAYDTLRALEAKKIVVSTGKTPLTYMPIDPQEILDRYKAKYKQSMSFLKENLLSFSGDYVDPIINLRDKKAVSQNIERLLEKAKKEILLEAWNDDFAKYKHLIKAAHDRGVAIKIVGYNNVDCDFGLVYQHSGGDYLEKTVGKCFILTVDEKEGLVGLVNEQQGITDAVCTKNSALVFIMKEMIIHDMFLIDIENTVGSSITEVYGKNLIKLREKLLGSDFRLKMH